MHNSDARLARVLMDRNLGDAEPLAGCHHSEQSTAIAQPGWLPWQSYRLLGQLGAWLVTLGERLEQYTPVRPSP